MDTPHYQIIDTLGCFVVDPPPDDATVNWSKVNFEALETNGRLSPATRRQVIARCQIFFDRVSQQGYDTISLDDVAHMVIMPWYSPELKRLLGEYQALYQAVIACAKDHGLRVLVNTDYMFWNDEIADYSARTRHDSARLMHDALRLLWQQMPDVSGIIMRVGESDGHDVNGRFVSRLALHTPRAANQLLRRLLPLCERAGKTLVFRTWTVGAYQLGDLIWNKQTFDTVFGTIDSPALVISMKYGDTDFMRYLALSPLFFHSRHAKILELQTRREWEGMGALPSFVGWDYARYLAQLRTRPDFVGIHVWCQTGGWAKAAWSNVTYLDQSSLWVELNTEVTAAVYRHGQTVEQALDHACQARGLDTATMIELLSASEIAIKKGLYISDVARQRLYFRRTRVPTLLWLAWDRVDLSIEMLRLIGVMIEDPAQMRLEAEQALAAARRMQQLGRQLGLDAQTQRSLDLCYATLELGSALRMYITGRHTRQTRRRLQHQAARYHQQFPDGYTVMQVVLPSRYRRLPIGFLARRLLRDSAQYRRRDKLLLKTSRLQRALVRYSARNSMLKDQSMGLESLFK